MRSAYSTWEVVLWTAFVPLRPAVHAMHCIPLGKKEYLKIYALAHCVTCFLVKPIVAEFRGAFFFLLVGFLKWTLCAAAHPDFSM